MKALVIGSTGATGKELVGQLLASKSWELVISIARRSVDLPPEYKDVDRTKLKEHLINLDNLATEAKDTFQGIDVVFCTLGTTRATAGSAEQFLKVDLEYVTEAAKLAKASNVPQFSLLSAQGANSKIWASHLKPFHPLLYAQTKGKAEESVKNQGFQHSAIFRPGLLIRGNEGRGSEKLFARFVSSINVKDLAKVMILEAESKSTGVSVYEMAKIQEAAEKNTAPVA